VHPPVFSIVFDYVRVCLVHVGGCSETNGALSAGTETHNIYISGTCMHVCLTTITFLFRQHH